MERRLTTLVAALLLACSSTTAQLYFPPVDGSSWESVSPTELGWCTEHLDSLYALLARNGTRSFIVLHNGRIAIEWYAEEFLPTDQWYWASAGKSLTAALVGIAQRDADLDIRDPSSRYLGEGWSALTQEQEGKITVRHHLTMTTGLDDAVADPDCTVDTCLKFKAEPGTRWAYHNAPYTLLDKVIQGATGSTLNTYFARKLRDPIGMDGLFVKQGSNNVLVSTARSMARYGLLVQSGFVWDGTPILDDANYVKAMLHPSQDLNKSYGYLWWLNGQSSFMIPQTQFVFPGTLIPNQPPDGVNALGKNNQILSVVPSAGLVVVRMGDAAGEDGSLVPTVFPNNLWGALRKVVCTITSVSEGTASGEQRVANQSVTEGIVRLRAGQRGDVDIYDVTGTLRMHKTDAEEIDVSSLPSGVYVLRRSADEQHTLLMITGR